MEPVLEKTPSLINHSFECFEKVAVRDFDCPYHFHPEIEITLIVSGSGQRLVGDHLDRFEAGDLLLIGGNLPHMYRLWDTKDNLGHSIYLQFSLEKTPIASYPELQSAHELLKLADRGVKFPKETSGSAYRIMSRILSAPPVERMILFLQLLKLLVNSPGKETIASSSYKGFADSKAKSRLVKALNYIDLHFAEKIRLEELADLVNLHPQAFSRFFSQHLGKSFREYLTEIRLSHASRALLDEEVPITQIAFSCGFNNLANFNRLFKRSYQKTPSNYRKELLDSVS